jgi:release factor glutamine methyltransferase
MIYPPAEDSYLMSDILKEFLKNKPKTIRILDMGSGSGIQAKTCRDLGFTRITTADINPEAIRHLKKQKFNAVKTDLFSNLYKKGGLNVKGNLVPLRFGLIIFNPPYLPEDTREPEDSKIATTAGKKGYELIIRFLEQAKYHLSPDGKILLLFSSLSKPNIIKRKAKELGYSLHLLNKSNMPFFEILYVYQLSA